ncbi:hypothetical protein [Paraliomyxa miuraensis]|uniref:hypothetical protein n=1 Tax=Paraliomyxa miuraensis TaxID=376150 RepID=UPI002253950D|nr:hypothetical protein [Paraliomyxa miuraensis]MCX4245004.1 hypothetical protein [Paraliomyxa miuraensis]
MYRTQLEALIASGRISFDAGHVSTLRDQLLDETRWPLRKLVVELVTNAGPIRISSVTGGSHSPTSHHYLGRAIDIGNEERADEILPYLGDNVVVLQIDQLIFHGHDGNLREGKHFEYSQAVLDGHKDHIHLSVLPERAEREIFLAAVEPTAPHADPVTDAARVMHAPATDGLAGATTMAFAARPSLFDEDRAAVLDLRWAARGSKGARLALDIVAGGDQDSKTTRRVAAALYDAALASGDDRLRAFGAALGPEGRAALTGPVVRTLERLGLAPASVDAFRRLMTGIAQPQAVALDLLRNEVSRHVPEKFAPLLDIGASLLLGQGDAAAASVATAVFGGRNEIAGIIGAVALGMGPGVAVQGALAAGMRIFGATRGSDDPRVLRALDEMKEDLRQIKRDMRELKQSVAALRQELRLFSQQTQRNFDRIFQALDSGFDAILQDTSDIRTRLGGIERELDQLAEGLGRILHGQDVIIAVELQTARDEIETELARTLQSTFDFFQEARPQLSDTAELKLRESMAFFFVHATRSAFSAAMSLGSLSPVPVASLTDAMPLLRAAPSVEYVFGLLPALVRLSGRTLGDWHGPSLPRAKDGLPNPVEFARGADAFLQLLVMAPSSIQKQYVDEIDTLLAVAERLRRFVVQLRTLQWLSSVNMQRFILAAREQYRHEHDLQVPLVDDGREFRLVIGPKEGWADWFNYVDQHGEVVAMRIHAPERYAPWTRSHDPIDLLMEHGLLEVTATQTIDLYETRVPALWSDDETPAAATVSRLRTRPPAAPATAFMVEYQPQYFKPDARAVIRVDELHDLSSAQHADTQEFITSVMDALPQWHRRHVVGLHAHIREAFARDQITVPQWEASRLANQFVARVRLHDERLISDDVLRHFMTPAEGGPAMTREDLLRWWDGHDSADEIDSSAPMPSEPWNPWIGKVHPPDGRLPHDGRLALVEACAKRLRAVASALDGQPRPSGCPTGLHPDEAIVLRVGDRVHVEVYEQGHVDRRWRYWTVGLRQGQALTLEVSNYEIAKPTISFFGPGLEPRTIERTEPGMFRDDRNLLLEPASADEVLLIAARGHRDFRLHIRLRD